MKYVYWVAYSHRRGSGATEMAVFGAPLTTGEQVMAMTAQIERNRGFQPGDIVVMSFQLLRTEP